MDLCVKPERKKEFFTEQLKWMPLPECNAHKQEFITSKVSGIEWKPGQRCKDRLEYLKRKTGLFKTKKPKKGCARLRAQKLFLSQRVRE